MSVTLAAGLSRWHHRWPADTSNFIHSLISSLLGELDEPPSCHREPLSTAGSCWRPLQLQYSCWNVSASLKKASRWGELLILSRLCNFFHRLRVSVAAFFSKCTNLKSTHRHAKEAEGEMQRLNKPPTIRRHVSPVTSQAVSSALRIGRVPAMQVCGEKEEAECVGEKVWGSFHLFWQIFILS